MEDYEVPTDVMESWAKLCRCCPDCHPTVCGGVQQGGLCDEMCRCSSIDHADDTDGVDWDEE